MRKSIMSCLKILRLATLLLYLLHDVSSQCPARCDCPPDTPEIIDCSGRGFTELPNVTKPARANRLDLIDFSNNFLSRLDIDELFKFIQGLSVEKLDFSSNEIREINGTLNARDGRDFRTFNLSRNALSAFPQTVVPEYHFKGTYILDLSYNRITELPSRLFGRVRDPTLPGFQFNASNNLISRVAPDAFQGVTILDAFVDLRSNRIRSLSEDFQPPRGLKELRMSDNPWNCSCDLRWIINPSNRLVNLTSIDPPSCQSPAGVTGRLIFELQGDEFTCLPFQNGPLRQNFVNMDGFVVRCPATADPPRFEVSWQVWMPVGAGDDSVQLFFTSETVGLRELQTNPRAAFQCTAKNNAGSITLALDIRYNGVPGIGVPECPQAVAPDQC